MPRTVSAFISYRRKEAYNVETNFIDRLVEALTAMGVDVFIDRDITPGDDYHARLFREVRDRDLFIPLLGADWLTLAQEREAAGERDVVQQETWRRRSSRSSWTVPPGPSPRICRRRSASFTTRTAGR
jgi:hypothetical protein